MSTLAKAVWRGDSGAVHYLSSTPEGSVLIVTDPVLGVERVHLDGPCRMVTGSSSYMYLSISATGSTQITPTATGLLISEYGFCTYCMTGPHDYELWPVCPSERIRQQLDGQLEVPPVVPVEKLEPDPVPVEKPPGPAPEPALDPAQPVRGARLRSLFRLPGDPADTPQVDPEVEEAARVLASRVWASGPSSRTWLRNGLPAALVDQYLLLAQDRHWLDVGREVVNRGLVDPRPRDVSDLSQVDGVTWGPGDPWSVAGL
jgi:hypothetical protein